MDILHDRRADGWLGVERDGPQRDLQMFILFMWDGIRLGEWLVPLDLGTRLAVVGNYSC